jgi:beta-lactamase regulating signal transducer with metallopeptidase domain
MDQQKLPNVTIALVLGIVSYLCCFCSSGIGGVVMSGIALFLISKDNKTYQENPDQYSNFSQLKTAKIVAIIGLVLGIATLLYTIYAINQMGGIEGYMEKVRETMEQYGIEE